MTLLKRIKGRAAFSCLFMLFLFQGCLEIDVMLKIRPDGSGTITETVLFSESVIGLANLQTSVKNGDKAGEGLYDVNQLKSKAGSYGQGVSFSSVKALKKNDKQGYVAKYSFKNISSLNLQYNPAANIPKDLKKMNGSGDAEVKSKPLTFSFQKGSPARLVIRIPLDSAGYDFSDSKNPVIESALDTNADVRMTEKIAEMMGVKFKVALQCDGKIINTDAQFRHGNEIVLFGLDLARLIKENRIAARYNLQKYSSFYQMREFLSKVPGIEMNFQDSITVQFKK